MKWLLASMIFFSSQMLALEPLVPRNPELVVWNVGQGLWTTWVGGETCEHYDAGGEHAPWRSIRETCGSRQNQFNFSHWDSDHISFAARAAGLLKDSCLEREPRGEGNQRKRKIVFRLKPCRSHDVVPTSELLPDPLRPRGRTKATSNEVSRVFLVQEVIIPGDSDRAAEKTWRLRAPPDARLLVLGHHGSRTSTSEELLRSLPHLLQAVASARFKKYGHPHKEVVDRLKRRGVALLRTEDWGSLHFELKPACTPGTPCPSFSRQARK